MSYGHDFVRAQRNRKVDVRDPFRLQRVPSPRAPRFVLGGLVRGGCARDGFASRNNGIERIGGYNRHIAR
jgi:hypothetical protein